MWLQIIIGVPLALVVISGIMRVAKRFFRIPAPAYVGRFLDSSLREWLQPPDRVVERSGVSAGLRVLEIGCGSGAQTTEAAKRVAPGGSVVALDVQEGMLRQLGRKLSGAGAPGVRPLAADACALPFRAGSFDLVFVVAALQEIPDRHGALGEVRRVLRPGGRLAVTEFLPDPDYALPSTTAKLVEGAGMTQEATEGNLWDYTMRFRRGEA